MGVIVQPLQHFTGNNYFFFYKETYIFTAVGRRASYQTSTIIGIVNFASIFMPLVDLKEFGRIKVLIFSS